MKRLRINLDKPGSTPSKKTTPVAKKPRTHPTPKQFKPKQQRSFKLSLPHPQFMNRVKISPRHWYLIMGVLIVGLLLSSINTYGMYQQPHSVQDSIIDFSYMQRASFDYTATLQNNTVYGTTTLRPGQGVLFKRIVDSIDASLSYSVQVPKSLSIEGTYGIQARLVTSYWEKQYTIVPVTTYATTSNENAFTARFPIDVHQYESIVQSINSETGVNAADPKLIIQSTITMRMQNEGKLIAESFRPSLTIPLNKNTIEFSNNLTQTQRGVQMKTIEVENQDVGEQQTNWSAATIVLLGGTIAFPLLVNRGSDSVSELEKTKKKLLKKYGEFIVQVQHKPDVIGAKSIAISSMDDLVKVSEELGKPVLYKNPNDNDEHSFYVVDNNMVYYYQLK